MHQTLAKTLITQEISTNPKGGDALRLGSKGRYGSCVGGR